MFDINALPKGDQPAIIYADQQLSWSEFHATYNSIRNTVEKQLKDKHRAIILLHDQQAEQTPHMAIYILLALSLNIPFVPLDRNLPQERRRYIVSMIACGLHVDCIDGTIKAFDRKPATPPPIPSETAYIIFTSGTTGKPKGVMIDRHSITEFCHWFNQDFPPLEAPVFSLSASYSFDLSLMSIFPFLAQGHSLWINSQSDRLASIELPMSIRGRNIHWVSTPSYIMLQLLNRDFNGETMDELKVFNFCGEPLEQNLVATLQQRFPRARIFNSYGPTEATIAVSTVEITNIESQSHRERLPIGEHKHPLSIVGDASEGELIINSAQVMSGYIGNEPTQEAPLQRRYASGDVVTCAGNYLYLLDRIDAQIKYRGYRIDLAEINGLLCHHPHVQFAKTVAITRQGSVVRIVSFCVSDPAYNFSENRLKTRLSKYLPHYAVPSEIRRVDTLPMTQRHKLDTSALLQLSQEPAQ